MPLLKSTENVGNPIVYVFLTLIISSITYILYDDYKKLTIFIAGFFFSALLYKYSLNFAGSLLIVFIIGILLNNMYYAIPQNINNVVRIKNVNSYGITASYKGKNINLNIKDADIKNQERYKIKGEGKVNEDFKYGIIGEINVYTYKKIEDDFITNLARLKENTYKRLEDNLGVRKSGLISSISFGFKDYLDSEDKEDMSNWGIIHTISVSGLHVMLVYGFLQKIIGKTSALAVTMLYVIFTGCAYSSIRAFIMLLSIIGAGIAKRNNNSLSAISLSGIIIMLNNPNAVFQLSFQLSFLATAGIILLKKYFDYKLYKLNPKLREGMSITLSAQVFTMPLIMLTYNEVSLNFVLGNLILVPIINLLVIAGNLSMIIIKIPFIFDFASYCIDKIINILDYSMRFCEYFNILPVYTNEHVVTLYCIMLISAYFIKKNFKKFIYLPIISLLIILVQIYSPILTIKNYEEGAVLIAYRGKRILCCNDKCRNIKSLKNRIYASNTYVNKNSVNIRRSLKIINNEDKLFLHDYDKNAEIIGCYYKKHYEDYDIINFDRNNINTLYIFEKDGKNIILEGIV